LDNTDISILSKGKTSASTNDVKAYNKKTLGDKICKLTTTNVQLMINKIKTEKVKVNLETDKIQLLDKKNFLIIKKEKLQIEITVLNVVELSNVLIHRY